MDPPSDELTDSTEGEVTAVSDDSAADETLQPVAIDPILEETGQPIEPLSPPSEMVVTGQGENAEDTPTDEGSLNEDGVTEDAVAPVAETDDLEPESDNDVIFGGTGDDLIFGEGGDDTVFGNDSPLDDALLLQLLSDRLSLS